MRKEDCHDEVAMNMRSSPRPLRLCALCVEVVKRKFISGLPKPRVRLWNSSPQPLRFVKAVTHFAEHVLTRKQRAESLEAHCRTDFQRGVRFGDSTSDDETARQHGLRLGLRTRLVGVGRDGVCNAGVAFAKGLLQDVAAAAAAVQFGRHDGHVGFRGDGFLAGDIPAADGQASGLMRQIGEHGKAAQTFAPLKCRRGARAATPGRGAQARVFDPSSTPVARARSRRKARSGG